MRSSRQSGYALLLVFAMAAAVAILLYTELPRVVFEGQRLKEQTLIDRGEQYQRAIQLYVRKHRKYPANLDELEGSRDVRFLRKRYKDPMTGKDEWRLIQIDANGVLLNSLVHKRPEQEAAASQNTFVTEGAAFGSTGPAPGQQLPGEGALQRRASDRPAVPAGGGMFGPPPPPGESGDQQLTSYAYPAPGQGSGELPPGQQSPWGPQPYPGQIQPFQPEPLPGGPAAPGGIYIVPGQPTQPGLAGNPPPFQPGGAMPGYPGQGVYPTPLPNQLPGGFQPGMQAPVQQPGLTPFPQPPMGLAAGGQAVQVYPGQNPQFGGVQPGQQPQPRIPGLPGPYSPFGRLVVQPPASSPPTAPSSSQAGGAVPFPYSPQGQPGARGAGAAPQNEAIRMIQQLLTTPRQGGPPPAAMAGGQGIGGGIAGVASMFEAEGIKIYNDRTKYNEWEFIYDFRKDQKGAGGQAAGAAPVLPGSAPGGALPSAMPQAPGQSPAPAFPGQQPSMYPSPAQAPPGAPTRRGR